MDSDVVFAGGARFQGCPSRVHGNPAEVEADGVFWIAHGYPTDSLGDVAASDRVVLNDRDVRAVLGDVLAALEVTLKRVRRVEVRFDYRQR